MIPLTEIKSRLAENRYIVDDDTATALQLTVQLGRPLLLEGEAGVGKTEVAKALASMLDTKLIRLQCYEGLDASTAIYEWNYQKQLLAIKVHEKSNETTEEIEKHIFSEAYLLKRPLLESISQTKSPVLLIDEIDRADLEFEAYLLEVLSEFQISIPELGTIKATAQPHVILTSNGTRELSDALRRRCLYSFVDYPDLNREVEILHAHLPEINIELAEQIARFVKNIREEDLEKVPGIAETLDWTKALLELKISNIAKSIPKLQASLICLLKTEKDLKSITPEITSKIAEA